MQGEHGEQRPVRCAMSSAGLRRQRCVVSGLTGRIINNFVMQSLEHNEHKHVRGKTVAGRRGAAVDPVLHELRRHSADNAVLFQA